MGNINIANGDYTVNQLVTQGAASFRLVECRSRKAPAFPEVLSGPQTQKTPFWWVIFFLRWETRAFRWLIRVIHNSQEDWDSADRHAMVSKQTGHFKDFHFGTDCPHENAVMMAPGNRCSPCFLINRLLFPLQLQLLRDFLPPHSDIFFGLHVEWYTPVI
jgi:hypothetical protein